MIGVIYPIVDSLNLFYKFVKGIYECFIEDRKVEEMGEFFACACVCFIFISFFVGM